MEILEYIESDTSTWCFQKLPDIPASFQEELTGIGGLNPHGLPNLRVVKGNEVMSDRAETKQLKYLLGFSPVEVAGYKFEKDGVSHFVTDLADAPADALVLPDLRREPLGLLRYVIESWTSPQELENQRRFTQRYAEGELEATLRTFPREGIYEAYYIVQNAEGGFRKLDNAVLDFIRFKWSFDKKTDEEKERIYDDLMAAKALTERKEYEEKIDAALEGDYRLPQDEIERRNEFWAKYDYSEDRARGLTI
jgi:hypothetical protein